MFFYLSKILTKLLFPFPLFILISTWACWTMKRGWPKRIFAFAVGAMWILSCSALSNAAMRWWESPYDEMVGKEAPQSDVIVVLTGMMQLRPGHSSAKRLEFSGSVDRILVGLECLRQGKAPLILISGGSGSLFDQEKREADLLRNWLVEQGVNPEQILIERNSRTTSENAVDTAKLAAEHGWKNMLLVTSAWHMRRSLACFRHAGLEVEPWPADFISSRGEMTIFSFIPSGVALWENTRLLKEILGIAAYWISGRL